MTFAALFTATAFATYYSETGKSQNQREEFKKSEVNHALHLLSVEYFYPPFRREANRPRLHLIIPWHKQVANGEIPENSVSEQRRFFRRGKISDGILREHGEQTRAALACVRHREREILKKFVFRLSVQPHRRVFLTNPNRHFLRNV